MVRPFFLSLVLVGAASLSAQRPAPPASQGAAPPYAGGRLGAIFGTVEDSVHDGPLVEAVVTVVQRPGRSAMTTSAGAFRIDSLPPGKYTLELLHPLLDSLGVRVISDTITVTGGALQTTLVSVPSAQTLATTLCSPLKRRLGPAVIVGQVLNVDSGTPAEGAEVSAAWISTEISETRGVRSVPNLRKTTVAADGTYRLCGMPASFIGSIQATRGTARTAEIRMEASDAPLVLRTLHLPPPERDVSSSDSVTVRVSTLRTGPGTLAGNVTNKGGVAISGALVTVQGGASSAKTGADGHFAMTGVPLGTQSILVRRVGYAPVEIPADISTRGPNTMAVRLQDYVPQLAPVEVKRAAPSELQRVGFDRRKARGFGRFMTEDDIEKAAPILTSDLFRRISGLHVVGSGSSVSVLSSRGEGCVRYVLDRNNINPSDGLEIDQMISPKDLAAIEVYQSANVPAEFMSGRNAGCAVIVLWTRTKLKEPPKDKDSAR